MHPQIYKVQLKNQTLGGNGEQIKLFRGVAGQKNRQGELFGLENLLKFKDGSFMSELFQEKKSPDGQMDVNDIAQAINNAGGMEGLEDAAEAECELADAGPKTKKRSINPNDSNSDSECELKGINHNDYFNRAKGEAKGKDGDDDVEMGALSQMVNVHARMAVEG